MRRVAWGLYSIVGAMSHLRFEIFVFLDFSAMIKTYSMKQPDLYYFEAIKMTSQAL